MFETRQRTIGGSQTGERVAEDALGDTLGTAVHGAHGAMQMAGGNYLGAVRSLLAVKRDLGVRQNPELNNAIAKLLFNPDVQLEQLVKPTIAATPARTGPLTGALSASQIAQTLGLGGEDDRETQTR